MRSLMQQGTHFIYGEIHNPGEEEKTSSVGIRDINRLQVRLLDHLASPSAALHLQRFSPEPNHHRKRDRQFNAALVAFKFKTKWKDEAGWLENMEIVRWRGPRRTSHKKTKDGGETNISSQTLTSSSTKHISMVFVSWACPGWPQPLNPSKLNLISDLCYASHSYSAKTSSINLTPPSILHLKRTSCSAVDEL